LFFLYCSLFLALTSLLRNCGSPIILLFSQLGVGTSHLYIRATISLELGLKPNLVFNPRLVASPISLLRVLSLSRFKAPFEALPSSLHNSTLGCGRTSLQTLIGCQPLRQYKETPVFAYKSRQLLLRACCTLRPLDLNRYIFNVSGIYAMKLTQIHKYYFSHLGRKTPMNTT